MDFHTKKPLYLQIYDDLKEKIAGGQYKNDEFLPSERELGEYYNVERATVRRALQLLVKDGLLVKIPGSGSKITTSDPSNENRMEQSGNNIAFILPADSPDKITEPFTSNIFYHFEQECKKQNYHLFYTNLTAEEGLPDNLLQNDLKGIVWVSRIPHNLILKARELGIPSLLISNSYPDCLSILCDNTNGIYQAVEHLLSLGHRKIAYIGGIPSYLNAVERRDGYLRALSHAGLHHNPKLMMTGDWSFDSGYSCTLELLKKTRDFTAVCCANDVMALGAMKALMVSGLCVPDDVSVIGFDNIEQCRYSTPALSTIGIDTALFARQMMNSLTGLIVSGSGAAQVKLLIQPQLCIRESTAAAKSDH